MSRSCEVEFLGNPGKHCFAGQRVDGRVSIDFDKSMTCKKLKIVIEGISNVLWSYSASQVYYDRIEHFKNDIIVKEPNPGSCEITIEPGSHSFDFHFNIPADCPSSYERMRGYIRYMVRVIFVKPLLNFTRKFPFTVVNPLDLNKYDTNLEQPFSELISKKLWLGLSKDRITLEITIPRGGFVSGEVIPINLMISNSTSANINEVVFKLVISITYTSRRQKVSHTEKKTLASKTVLKEMISGKECMVVGTLTVPSTVPTTNKLCEILDISYRIEVSTKLSGVHSIGDIKLPIVIGVIPIGVTSNSRHNENFSLDHYDIDPPTYEMATFMEFGNFSSDKDGTEEESKFMPTFPRFQFR